MLFRGKLDLKFFHTEKGGVKNTGRNFTTKWIIYVFRGSHWIRNSSTLRKRQLKILIEIWLLGQKSVLDVDIACWMNIFWGDMSTRILNCGHVFAMLKFLFLFFDHKNIQNTKIKGYVTNSIPMQSFNLNRNSISKGIALRYWLSIEWSVKVHRIPSVT